MITRNELTFIQILPPVTYEMCEKSKENKNVDTGDRVNSGMNGVEIHDRVPTSSTNLSRQCRRSGPIHTNASSTIKRSKTPMKTEDF